MSIHPSAVVAEGAVVPDSCEVGPFSTIGPDVVLGEDCRLISHVVLDGRTRHRGAERVLSLLRSGHGAAGFEVWRRADAVRLSVMTIPFARA